MRLSRPCSMSCPKGYAPIPLPAAWRKMSENAYASQPPIFKLKIKDCPSFEVFADTIIERLMNLRETRSVCMSQLAKLNSNIFGLGLDLDDDELKSLYSSSTYTASVREWSVEISAFHIYLFQKLPIKS